MIVFMLGFAGFPLTGGFVGKFYVFAAAYEHGWTWLVIVGVVATAVSLYYYLGVIRAMYIRARGGAAAARRRRRLAAARAAARRRPSPAAIVVTVGSFFVVQPLIDVARPAASGSALTALPAWPVSTERAHS